MVYTDRAGASVDALCARGARGRGWLHLDRWRSSREAGAASCPAPVRSAGDVLLLDGGWLLGEMGWPIPGPVWRSAPHPGSDLLLGGGAPQARRPPPTSLTLYCLELRSQRLNGLLYVRPELNGLGIWCRTRRNIRLGGASSARRGAPRPGAGRAFNGGSARWCLPVSYRYLPT